MSTSDEDHTGKEGMSMGEPATGKRKEAPRHDEEAHSDDASPDVGNDFGTSNLFEVSRSERKREREKKRRGDVNQGLDQLMTLVFTIDPELRAEAEERHRKSHSNRVATRVEPEAMLSRVELINAAVATLHRVHQENEERKMVISQLSRELLSNGGSAGPVSQPIPSSFATSYSNHDARTPGIQQRQVIEHHNLNAAALAKAGIGRRESLRNGDASALLHQYLALQQPTRRPPAPNGMMGAQPPHNLSIEAILGGIHNGGPPSSQPDSMALLRELEQARSRGGGPSSSQPGPTMAFLRELQARSRAGGIQNATAGPSSSQADHTALLRELEQTRSMGDLGSFRSLLQRGIFDGESGNPALAANNLSSLLGQHSMGQAPSLPRSADIGALLQQISNQQMGRDVRRDDRNR